MHPTACWITFFITWHFISETYFHLKQNYTCVRLVTYMSFTMVHQASFSTKSISTWNTNKWPLSSMFWKVNSPIKYFHRDFITLFTNFIVLNSYMSDDVLNSIWISCTQVAQKWNNYPTHLSFILLHERKINDMFITVLIYFKMRWNSTHFQPLKLKYH